MLPGCHNRFNRPKPDVKPLIPGAVEGETALELRLYQRKQRRGRQVGIKSNDSSIKVAVFGPVFLAVYRDSYHTFIILRRKVSAETGFPALNRIWGKLAKFCVRFPYRFLVDRDSDFDSKR